MSTLKIVADNRALYISLASDAIDNEFERIAREVYNGRLSGDALDDALIAFTAEHLFGGVLEGYGEGFDAVDYNTPDAEMLASLERDVYFFSSAKNFNELADLNLAMLADDGQLRSFGEFKKIAAGIHTQYNGAHLSAEYQHAVASSQMAGQWVRIEQTKKLLPLLKYVTVGDARVRQSHRALEGIIKPVDDPFWDAWFPPNGWHCRCQVIQLSEGTETPDDKISYPDDAPEYFKTNTGKRGVVYPPGHPYHDLPDEDDEQRINRKAAQIHASKTKAYKRLQTFKNGGKIDVHPLADKSDLRYNINLGTQLAKKGYEVKLRPHYDAIGVKNPEAEINGLTADFKETKEKATAQSIQSLIRSAASQRADMAALYLTHPDLTRDALKGGIYAALRNDTWNKSIKKLLLIYDDFETVEIERKEIKDYAFADKLRR